MKASARRFAQFRVIGLGLSAFAVAFAALAGYGAWTGDGPAGGSIRTLAIDPSHPTTVFYAGGDGGVFKSVDGGASWGALGGSLTQHLVWSLAIDPSVPATLYAATDGGIFKSTDGGGSWAAINSGLTSLDVTALAIDPKAPATLYAGTFEYGCEGPCLFKSTNGGGIWVPISITSPNPDVTTIAIDPTTPATLYVGTYGSGAFKSSDGGGSWTAIDTGLSFVRRLAIDRAAPATLYAVGDGGVFKSSDGGGSWTAINAGLTNMSVSSLAIDPADPATLYAGGDGGVFKSSDGGGSWTAINDGLPNTAVFCLAIDPAAPSKLYAGTAGTGVFDYQNLPPAVPVATVGELLAGVLGQPAELPNYFVIPVAGHVAGYNNTEFRTDVTVLAGGTDPQRIAIAWLAEGVDNSAQPLAFFEVGPGPVFFGDIVAATLDKKGLGAIVVAAVTAEGSLDPAARLRGYARAWTPVTGCSGTASLEIEASRFIASSNGSATGLLLDAGHRSTVGIVNPNAQARTWTVYFATGPVEISLPAASMRQIPQPQTNAGPIEVFVIDKSGPCPPLFRCGLAGYGASIDQISGDGWLVSFTQ